MPPETVLLESRTLRDTLIGRTDVLDKVKALALLPDGLHLTTRMVADYFEVGERAINSVLRRHRAELAQHGMRILKASDLREFHSVNMTPWKRSYPQAPVHLTVYTRRTVLGVAMLLRDSEVARAVRRYLLDVEEEWRSTRRAAVSARPGPAEGAWQEAARALRELAPLVGRMSVRLERMERRLGATDRVVAALGVRLCDLGEDVRALRGDVRDVRAEVGRLRRQVGR